MTVISRRGALMLTASAAGFALARPALAQKRYRIGFSQATMNHPWRVAMVETNNAYIDVNLSDVEFIFTDGQDNANKQVADVESLMVQGLDVLMISPVTADALTPVVADVMAAGIPVLTIDREVNTDVTSHIGARNLPIGEAAGQFLVNKFGGKAKIIELQGSAGASATVDRNVGFANGLKGHEGMKIVANPYCDYLQEKALAYMVDALQRFGPGEFDAIYTHADEMAFAAIQAMEEAGRTDPVSIVAINGANGAIDLVAEGKMDATFTYPYCAPEGVQYAYKVAKGETIEKEIILNSVAVTAENAEEMRGKGY
ncbi:substrate-binding domain-containing protein [Nitratireductor luteus]|uniref:substrate-binding domain-containing protein n=1 Tax=Nitratireductor luteus TaxID=2976980 RepID=UPI00223EF6FC|nr:substrate-binding domain-containing protein [Nitratireductor luteus]